MLDMFLLVLATTCDSFFMSIAYGVERIRIPWKAIVIITSCGTAFLGISMTLAGMIEHVLTPEVGKQLSFTILFILGLIHLFQAQVKFFVKKYKHKPLIIRFQEVSFVIDIMLDEKEADIDHSKELSVQEAMYLGIALSLDSLASGLAYGIGFTNVGLVMLLSFIMGIGMIISGRTIGLQLKHLYQGDVSWISGCMLLLLAFLRLK